MKLKKLIIMVVCCVIIASMGITLTGCGNSSDKDSGKNSGVNSESSTETNVESSTETNAENSTDTNAKSSTEMNDENRYLGTWAATVMESDEGDVYNVEESIGAYEFTFNADNTFSGSINGDVSDGTWELTEDGVKIMEPNGVSDEFIYKDGELLWKIDMADVKVTCHFVKKQ